MRFRESASQTAGPYVHIGCVPNFCGLGGVWPEDLGARMITGEAKGERITIRGSVIDGAGMALRDAMVEIWQADAAGLYASPEETRGAADPHFTGFGRRAGDYETGEWTFETIRPGPVPGPGGRLQAPHVTFWIVARGINLGLHTRMYFPEDDLSVDPVLSRIEHRSRIPTLVARAEGTSAYRFDIHLQGSEETIFFEC
ncbi:MAG: protocatechuate 3,4-dioxygenase subunit alpha [Pikeienuella sp.]|uniref:protocatechuate 3,4-dioxygenase subunit alpha n=1 Tax=Pikeienuella sp. TaxID=2831957 RepID=UPI00391B89CD